MLTFDLVWCARWSGRSLPTFDLVFVQVEGRSLSLSTCLVLQVDAWHHFRPVLVRGGAAATLTFDPVLVQVEGRSLSLSTCLGLQVDECHRFRPVLVRGGAAARSLSTSSCRRGIDRVAGRLEGGNFYLGSSELDPKWQRRSRWNDDDDGDTEDEMRTITDDDEIDKLMRC